MSLHSQPNATVIDGKDGSTVGTLDLGGAPEQAVSDGQGHLYVDIEDKDNIAVVDVKTLKVTAHYDLGGKGGGPAGLGLDAKNGILFAMCRNPQNVCRPQRRGWEDPRHPADRPGLGRRRFQSQHHGSLQFAGRWHPDHHQRNQPDELSRWPRP